MGAVPKKKPSKTRQRSRHRAWENRMRANLQTNLVKCEKCGTDKFSHRMCPECGTYHGEKIIEPKAEVKHVST